jgi:hypothetical protein
MNGAEDKLAIKTLPRLRDSRPARACVPLTAEELRAIHGLLNLLARWEEGSGHECGLNSGTRAS